MLGTHGVLCKGAADASPLEFRSCVAYLGSNTLIAVGPSGCDVSDDGGASWKRLTDKQGFHTVSVAGKVAWAAGTGGRVGRLVLPDE